jgi:hypothetical protein
LESEVHLVEQEAYTGVLRAFKVQSDALSWVNISSKLKLVPIVPVITVCPPLLGWKLIVTLVRRIKKA